MSPPSIPTGSEGGTTRPYDRLCSPRILQRLYRYATGPLRLAALDADHAGVFEAGDVVNALLEQALQGTLSWTLDEDATDDEVAAYACTKLKGRLSTLRRKATLWAGDDEALDALADEAPGALTLLVEHSAVAALLAAFAHDAEAAAHLREMLAGKTRTEIARTFGCDPLHADVVRKRIVRGVTALRATMDHHTEPEPRTSGVRGTYHEPQATEERQGAAREPLRGAGGARGRR